MSRQRTRKSSQSRLASCQCIKPCSSVSSVISMHVMIHVHWPFLSGNGCNTMTLGAELAFMVCAARAGGDSLPGQHHVRQAGGPRQHLGSPASPSRPWPHQSLAAQPKVSRSVCPRWPFDMPDITAECITSSGSAQACLWSASSKHLSCSHHALSMSCSFPLDGLLKASSSGVIGTSMPECSRLSSSAQKNLVLSIPKESPVSQRSTL